MKKQIILFLLLLTCFITHAQKYQPALLHGKEENRLDIATLLGIPNDTFAVPTTPVDKTIKPHIAAIGLTLYLYDIDLKKWSAYSSGGGAMDSLTFATTHRTDTMAQNIRDQIAALPEPTLQDVLNAGSSLSKNDTILMNGYKLSLLGGQIKTTGHSVSIKSADSVLVRDTGGNWKSISQWNLNGGQARTGIYLNSTKTWTKQTPYVFGTKLVFSGNSWANEGYTSGTPWPTQVTNYFGKTKVIRGRDADDITGMIMRDYNSFHGRQSDSIAFCDLSYVQIMSLIVGGTPISGVVYYADGSNLTKTTNYIKGSWRAFIANYYLDTDTISVNSLNDANFRAATTADSLNTKTAVGAIGLGSFSFTKPAGKTSVVIGTYGADGTRTNQGTVVVTNNGTEIFRKNFDSLNVANRGRDNKLKIGLNYEAIVLKDLPSASSTIEVTALNDSTRFDYIGYLVPADSAQKPLYINNLAYGAGNPGYHTSRSNIDSVNNAIQEAVFEFGEYPVFINNYNRTLDSTVDINGSRHLSSTGNDVVAAALLNNLVKIGYKPIKPIYHISTISAATVDTTTVPLITFSAGAGFSADTSLVTDSTIFGSFFTGQYEYTIKEVQAVIKGNSGDSIVLKIVYNDTFNVDGTKINGTGLSISDRYSGNNFTITTNRTTSVNSWLWLKPEAIIAGKKPKYISITLLGYKTYIAP